MKTHVGGTVVSSFDGQETKTLRLSASFCKLFAGAPGVISAVPLCFILFGCLSGYDIIGDVHITAGVPVSAYFVQCRSAVRVRFDPTLHIRTSQQLETGAPARYIFERTSSRYGVFVVYWALQSQG